MWNRLVVLIVFFIGFSGVAQELNVTVSIDSERIQQTNKQIFTTLQNSMRDFLNNNKFTTLNVRRNERIDCSIVLALEEYDPNSNSFRGIIQVQSSRAVYNSGYSSPIFNFRDNNVSFTYIESEPLIYSENAISSNLVGLLSFYANMIIGMDADSFAFEGGTAYYQKASNVVSMMQSSGAGDKGWVMGEANNRYALVNDILSGMYSSYRQVLYDYHINGLDLMSDNPQQAKNTMADALFTLADLHKTRPNAFPMRIFFDAKSDEIVQVFSAGSNYDNSKLIETLTRINPSNGSKWNRM